jgi:hypothetical protein
VLETPPNVVEGNPFAAIAELIKAAFGFDSVVGKALSYVDAPVWQGVL